MGGKKFQVKPAHVVGGVTTVVGLIILIVVIAKNSGDSKEVKSDQSNGNTRTGQSENGVRGGGGGGNAPSEPPKTCAQKFAEFKVFAESGATKQKILEAYQKGLLDCPNEFSDFKLGDNKAGDTNRSQNGTDENGQGDGTSGQGDGASGQGNGTGQQGDGTGQQGDGGSPPNNNQVNQPGNRIDFATLTPVQVKTERLKFIKEINQSKKDPNGPLKQDLKPLHEFLVGEGANHLAVRLVNSEPYHKAYSEPIKLLSDGKVFLRKRYEWDNFLPDFMRAEMIKATKVGNKELAQKYYQLYYKCFIVDDDYSSGDDLMPAKPNSIDDLFDIKFWEAIAASNWEDATDLLDEKLFLPDFLCEDLKADPDKLQILHDLSPDQMDALMDFKRLDEYRRVALENYLKYPGSPKLMEKYAAEYAKAKEQMDLLKVDLHPSFDVPSLPEVKTTMQKIRDYLQIYMPDNSYEQALEKVENDPNHSVVSILELLFSVLEHDLHIDLSQEFLILKRDMRVLASDYHESNFEFGLLEAFSKLFSFSFEAFDTDLKKAFSDYIKGKSPDKTVGCKTAKNAFQVARQTYQKCVDAKKGELEVTLALVDFWETYFAQNPISEHSGNSIPRIKPFSIDCIANHEMKEVLVPKCVQILKANSEWSHATEIDKTRYRYALDFLKVYNAMNGKDMHKLWQSRNDECKPYFLSVSPQVARSLLENKQKLGYNFALFSPDLPHKVEGYLSS